MDIQDCFEEAQKVIQSIFCQERIRNEVTLTPRNGDAIIRLPYGMQITQLGEFFLLVQVKPLLGGGEGETEVDEVGVFAWREILPRVCEIIAASAVQSYYDALDQEKDYDAWVRDMDEFYHRVASTRIGM